MGLKTLFISMSRAPTFEKQKILLNYKERQHISKKVLDKEGSIYVDTDSLKEFHYDPLGPKYVALTDLSYDFAISLYNFDSKQGVVYRFYKNIVENKKTFSKYLNDFALKNTEARIFGMQNNYFNKQIRNILFLVFEKNIKFYEIDLFGTEIRNIALNIETGQTFDILMENKLYKPGDLATKITLEEFESKIKINNLTSSN
ncbi:MAG: hypothetical protein ACP5UN_02025 [Candidatus Micrarchaeia archaeon]